MKKVVFFVVAAICATAMSATAQVSVENFPSCEEYLNANPQDTIWGKDNKGINFAVYKAQDGKIHRDTVKIVSSVKVDTVFMGTPKEVLAKVHAKAINNLTNEALIGKDGKRDGHVAHSSELAKYQKEIGQEIKSAGDVLVGPWQNKFGLFGGAYIGMGYDSSFKPLLGGELGYTVPWGEAFFRFGGASRPYTNNSEHEGRYMTYTSALLLGPSFYLDHYDTRWISILAGGNFETLKTDSKVASDGSRLRSSGSSIQWSVGLKFGWRKFGYGYSGTVCLLYNGRGDVNQNMGKTNSSYWSLTFSFNIPFARQRANYGKLPVLY